MTASTQDPAGWLQICARCRRMYWAAWQPSTGRVRRFEAKGSPEPHACPGVVTP